MREQCASPSIILKFGGASVAEPARFAEMATLIEQVQQRCPRVVVVVSAMAAMTDHLTSLAYQVHPSPPRREYDMLVSIGERMSIALLAMALAKRAVDAVSFTGSQSGIITCANHSDARILDVRPHRILSCLEEGKIAIVAGFQGVSENREITTLGRGGSDTTAVALAVALEADLVMYFKDVAGVYDTDPKMSNTAKRYSYLDYNDALQILDNAPKKVLHPRSVLLAKHNGISLHVRSFLEKDPFLFQEGTDIGKRGMREKGRKIYEG